MKKVKSKIVGIILTLTMVIGLMPQINTFAEGNTYSIDFSEATSIEGNTATYHVGDVDVTLTSSQDISADKKAMLGDNDELTLGDSFEADKMEVAVKRKSDNWEKVLVVDSNRKTRLSSGDGALNPDDDWLIIIRTKNKNGGPNPPEGGSQQNTGDVAINIKNQQGVSKAYYRVGDSGDFTEINPNPFTLRKSHELNEVNEPTKIYFKVDIDNSQVLDVNNQNWWREGSTDNPFNLDELKSGEAFITYDPGKSYEVQIAFDGGSGGGGEGPDNRNRSFDCRCMNGNEQESVEKVEVKLSNSEWENINSTNILDSLSENTKFNIRIKMKDGFTVDKISLRYEPFDDSFPVEYFKDESTDYSPIIEAILSDAGYEITFKPEADSKNADDQSTLSAENTCLRFQYQTAIVFKEKVNVNMFFQTQNGEDGYGVWRSEEGGPDEFVDGVGAGEIIFDFNGNTYGEQGDPEKLGYGKWNDENNLIAVKYISAYKNNKDKEVEDYPQMYDNFSVGGYTTGSDNNTIRIDDFDGLIDEVYIDSNSDGLFDANEKITGKEGDNPGIGKYYYYEASLNPNATYNVLIRRHLSTRVSLKWSYTDVGTDFYVDHGKIFIEKVVRGEDTLFEAEKNNGDLVLENGIPRTTKNDLQNDYSVSDNAGEVFLEVGDKVTIRLIPTYGYQISNAELNGAELTPNEEVSSFTFTVNGNLHLAGSFEETDDMIDVKNASKIRDAEIVNGDNAADSGNLSLEVADHSGTYDKADEALTKATAQNTDSTATTIATLDMTLDNKVSKGNGEYWTTNITEFEDPIKVNLNLNDTTYSSGDTYVVVREHNGQLEKLNNVEYSNGVLSIPTEKFSTYSIIKLSDKSDEIDDGNGNDDGKGDDVIGDDEGKPDDSKPGNDTDKPDDSKPGNETDKPDDSKPGDDINKPDDNTNKDDGTSSTDKIVIIESKNEIATTVSGKVIKSTMKIEQEEIAKTSDTYKQATSAIEKNGDKNLKEASYVKIYEINLLDGSTQVHDVGGVVEVSFKVPADLVVANDEKVVIYRVNNDGSLTKCNTKVVDGIITFETNHFSTYILAKEKSETVSTPTGNTTNNTVTNNTPANNTVTKNPVASAVTTAIKTGDTDKLILWIVLMLIGIAVLTTSIYNVRKAGHHKVNKN